MPLQHTESLFRIADQNPNGAEFSSCGLYRYRLWRTWANSTRICWILLNPSTADANHDDATIRKCIGFAKRWGYGGIDIINLFAFRATLPRNLHAASDPIGPRSDEIIRSYSHRTIIAAWGNYGKFGDRAMQVRKQLLGKQLFCLGQTMEGEPRHPLRLSYNTPLQPFTFIPTKR